jgi:lysozyme family protein
VKADALPAGLDLAVFDLAVNSGPGRAARLLQRVLDVREDGVIGPETLAAATARDPAATVRALTEERLRFLQRLKTWKTFGRGWRRRVEDVGAESLRLAGTAGALSAAARPPIRAVPAAAVPTSDGAAPGARAAPAPTSSPASSLTLVSKGTTMTDTKSVLASKTVWANLIGLAVLALGFLGVETGAVDQGALAEALTQLVAAASFIASTVFRMSATRRLT